MDDSRPATAEAAARLARAQRHALLFRRLVEACGGLPRIMELEITRLRRPAQLYRFADPSSRCFAPADVIEDLELFCGEPIYTRAVAESLPGVRLAGDLLKETCEATVAMGELMQLVLTQRGKPGGVSPRFRALVLAAVEHGRGELQDVADALGPEVAR